MRDPERQPCPACGFLVHAAAPGSGAACSVCGWVDDYEQLVHPDLTYGANAGTSLRQAQRVASARLATVEATGSLCARDPQWRPLREGETPAAEPDSPSSPVCYIATPDPRDFVPYWRRYRGM